jgi:hypothetical protein
VLILRVQCCLAQVFEKVRLFGWENVKHAGRDEHHPAYNERKRCADEVSDRCELGFTHGSDTRMDDAPNTHYPTPKLARHQHLQVLLDGNIARGCTCPN